MTKSGSVAELVLGSEFGRVDESLSELRKQARSTFDIVTSWIEFAGGACIDEWATDAENEWGGIAFGAGRKNDEITASVRLKAAKQHVEVAFGLAVGVNWPSCASDYNMDSEAISAWSKQLTHGKKCASFAARASRLLRDCRAMNCARTASELWFFFLETSERKTLKSYVVFLESATAETVITACESNPEES